ncbi:sugar dehydrogenase [Haloprofundus marisrubri]|uniref:Sugar dehydrogenase n=1 Tax=Haloprofundus marisrubri TaxID=1514971 RepID=A0A0W1RAZ1_9EURY|nr:PQQ-dependent sugar dehydrogenase [Haloprofundus marisrubri]KTG10518.1 sugar dehydrogenase [Haloprofundus marisrubri]
MPQKTSRRELLRRAGAAAVLGVVGSTQVGSAGGATEAAQVTKTAEATQTAGPNTVGIQTLTGGFEIPLDLAFVPGSRQAYVADQQGVVSVYEPGGLRDEPLLDLRDTVEYGGEKGLLGIAVHPNFAENRRLFVRYSAPLGANAPQEFSHTFVLSEFTVNADGRTANRNSERTVLDIPEPQPNHNAGDLAFGPDGYLYVTVGDGGNGGDLGPGHVDDWYGAVPGGNAQDVRRNLLGSILRIDVNGREGGKPYAIPDDNPLVGRPGFDEQYAWGFRNPWRLSFDRGRLFVADVGESEYEEVSLVESGGNYGWNVNEGTHCFAANSCPDRTPPSVRGGEPLVDPIIEYSHSGGPLTGNSVIGGYVYRGSAIPGLQGAYVFGDLDADGQLFVATEPQDGGRWPTRVVDVAGGGSGRLRRIFSFARDPTGELYVLGAGVDGGAVHRVVPASG